MVQDFCRSVYILLKKCVCYKMSSVLSKSVNFLIFVVAASGGFKKVSK